MMLKPLFLDIETLGLDPFESRIVAIGYDLGDPEVLIGEEKEIIEKFLEIPRDEVVLIGYNILGFDLPFLVARGLKHGINEIQKLRTGYVIDLMDVVSRYLTTSKRRWVNQKEVCSFLGLETKDVIDGSEIPLRNDKTALSERSEINEGTLLQTEGSCGTQIQSEIRILSEG